jgi:hypothetical protein
MTPSPWIDGRPDLFARLREMAKPTRRAGMICAAVFGGWLRWRVRRCAGI